MDDWAACDAEAVVAALSVRYRFSLANAVQLLRDRGILPQRDEEEAGDALRSRSDGRLARQNKFRGSVDETTQV